MKSNSDPVAFRYPPSALVRRHGPAGYSRYASFRPWLRDDFWFRCVYCLKRERWGRVSREFDLDHFVPQAHNPAVGTKYDNLLYSCHSCNLRRGSRGIPDPTVALIAEAIEVQSNGVLETNCGFNGEERGFVSSISRKSVIRSYSEVCWPIRMTCRASPS